MEEWWAGWPIWAKIGWLSPDLCCCRWGTGGMHSERNVNKADDSATLIVLAQSHERGPMALVRGERRPRTSQDGASGPCVEKGADERSSRRRPDRKSVRAFVFSGPGRAARRRGNGGPAAIDDFLGTFASRRPRAGLRRNTCGFGLGVLFGLDAEGSGRVAEVALPFHDNKLLRTVEESGQAIICA